MTRRHRLAATLASAGTVTLLLAGCLGTGPAAEPVVEDAEGPLTIQSRLATDSGAHLALEAVVEAFNAKGGGQVEINSVPNETFRDQLPSYLTSANPPDILTLFGGAFMRELADEGLVLDISDIWEDFEFSEGLRQLSSDSEGNEIFVPTSYYWVAAYYKKSVWEEAGAEVPETWDELLEAAETLKAAGVEPVGIALGDSPWLASAWFDYLNLRINGAEFHLDVLAGEESFDDPRIEAVFEKWDEIRPYFDPEAPGITFAQAATDLTQGRTGMFLAGSWLQFSLPPEELDEYDFFRFPIIDESVPLAEEGPTEGFFASSRTDQPNLAKEFLAYLATAEAQEIMFNANPSSTEIPANPNVDVELTPVLLQGQDILDAAVGGVTQFFNRDSSDALQATADQALTQYLAGVKPLDQILEEWQAEAERVRAG
jgi:multiple sugar transport system substrate-binding protein